jgi:hypothetical protein
MSHAPEHKAHKHHHHHHTDPATSRSHKNLLEIKEKSHTHIHQKSHIVMNEVGNQQTTPIKPGVESEPAEVEGQLLQGRLLVCLIVAALALIFLGGGLIAFFDKHIFGKDDEA